MQTNECTVTFKCEVCGVRKPEAERYRPRSAFTVCSQACLDTAAQKKAQTWGTSTIVVHVQHT